MKRDVLLSDPARADLEKIADRTRQVWGERQRKTYLGLFKACFKALGSMSGIGRPRADLAEGLRSIMVGRHLVLYEEGAREVHVVRILHVSEDIEHKIGDSDAE